MEKSKQQIRKPAHLLIETAEHGIHDGSKCTYTFGDQSVLKVELGGTRVAKDRMGRVVDECSCLSVV